MTPIITQIHFKNRQVTFKQSVAVTLLFYYPPAWSLAIRRLISENYRAMGRGQAVEKVDDMFSAFDYS